MIEERLDSMRSVVTGMMPFGFKVVDIVYKSVPSCGFYPPQGYSVSVKFGKHMTGFVFKEYPGNLKIRKATRLVVEKLLARNGLHQKQSER